VHEEKENDIVGCESYDRITATNMVVRVVCRAAFHNACDDFPAPVPGIVGSHPSSANNHVWLGAVCDRDLEAALSRGGFPRLVRSTAFRGFWRLLHVGDCL
jgi:hypothetical protein